MTGLERVLQDLNDLRDRLQACHDPECRVCKENERRIKRVKSAVYETALALRATHGAQQKIFQLLNAYAKKEDLAQWSATDPHGVIGQVYGDLAAEFGKVTQAVEKLA